MQNVISFPNLGLDLTVNRIAFSIGSLNVYWYGVIIAVGFMLSVIYCFWRCKEVHLKGDDLIDLLIFAVPFAIIGARLYYVIFNFDYYYYYAPEDIYKIWDGGIAIYGAIIFGVITAFVFCRVKRIRLGSILDVAAMGLLIGQCIGRWGNFVNQEAYGEVTNVWWKMQIYSREA